MRHLAKAAAAAAAAVEAASCRFQTRLEAASTHPSASIQQQTPLVPAAVARGVYSEVSVWLGAELPASWAELLTEKAELVSAHDPRFLRLLRQRGDRGRDWLWAFMRHWLAALLKQHRPTYFAHLPADYSRGQPLPALHHRAARPSRRRPSSCKKFA